MSKFHVHDNKDKSIQIHEFFPLFGIHWKIRVNQHRSHSSWDALPNRFRINSRLLIFDLSQLSNLSQSLRELVLYEYSIPSLTPIDRLSFLGKLFKSDKLATAVAKNTSVSSVSLSRLNSHPFRDLSWLNLSISSQIQ